MFDGAVVEFFLAGAVRCVRKHIRVGQMGRFMWPERFQSVVVGPSLGKEVPRTIDSNTTLKIRM
jgi:hypothetical protein